VRESVETFDDPRLIDYRNIRDAQLLTDHRIFVAEGRLVVTRLLRSRRFATRSVLVTPTALTMLADILSAREDVPVYEVAQETMNGVAGFDIHRGCLAIGECGHSLDPHELTATGGCLLGLERIANPDNVGGLFRNALAFGVDAIVLDHASADPLYRKALRTSVAAALDVPFARTANWPDTLATCRKAGLRLVALTPQQGAPEWREIAPSLHGERVMLVVGHEGDGLSDAALSACEFRARVAVAPAVDSLNVATAAAIALYELGRTRRDHRFTSARADGSC
jgi:tRNA G18 (ribose-2'-O)-methylase SpoU